MDNSTPVATVSAAFLDALAQQDYERLGACFHAAPRARLLTPSALAMPRDATGVGERFRQWFGEADVFDVKEVDVCTIGGENGTNGAPCISLRYRIELREHGGWYACEQQAYCWVQDGLFERIDVLCSGFQPIAAPGQGGKVEKMGNTAERTDGAPQGVPYADGVLELVGKPEQAGSTCAVLTPAVKARLRELEPGQVLEVRVDDPAAVDDMTAWTRLAGHELVQTVREGETIRFFVCKRKA